MSENFLKIVLNSTVKYEMHCLNMPRQACSFTFWAENSLGMPHWADMRASMWTIYALKQNC